MTPLDTRLGPGREFDFVRRVGKELADRCEGLGDDAFLFEIGGANVAISSDLAIEGIHFRQGWMDPDELGWRQASAALSDLAAVAARPRGILVDIAFSYYVDAGYPLEIMWGAGDAAQAVGAKVWGGDTVCGENITIDVTVFGELTGRPLRRSGARAGDTLWVTGALGGPGAALTKLLEGVEPDRSARERLVHPVARTGPAERLRDLGATAAIDLSDGLLPDARHLAAASGVQLTVASEEIPVHRAATGWRDALVSGEEYELLVTMPPGFVLSDTDRESLGVSFTRIGLVESGDGVVVTEPGGEGSGASGASGASRVEVTGEFLHFS